MAKIVVFPGSFDPITKGHESIVKRALPLFDKIIVAIGVNANKKYFFSLEERKRMIEKTFENESKVEVGTYEGLTVDYCVKQQASYILRGLRNTVDFEFEKNIGQMNKAIQNDIETIFLMTDPDLSAINSTIVRDIIRNGGNADAFLPDSIKTS